MCSNYDEIKSYDEIEATPASQNISYYSATPASQKFSYSSPALSLSNSSSYPAAIVQPLDIPELIPDPVVPPSPEQWDNYYSDDSMDEDEPKEKSPALEKFTTNTTLKSGTFKTTVGWRLSDDQINSLVSGYTHMVRKQIKFTNDLLKAKQEYQESMDAMKKARRRYLRLFKTMQKDLVLIDKVK